MGNQDHLDDRRRRVGEGHSGVGQEKNVPFFKVNRTVGVEDRELTWDQAETIGKAVFGPLNDALDLTKCDLSDLFPDYWCERRITNGDYFEVWEAWDMQERRNVAVMLFYRTEKVYMSYIAETLIEEQVEKMEPLARGGSGFSSYLVYPLEKGKRLGKRSRAPLVGAASIALIAVWLSLWLVWPAPQKGVITDPIFAEAEHVSREELFDGQIVMHVDYDPARNMATWSTPEGQVWMGDGNDHWLAYDPDGSSTRSVDLCGVRDEAVVVFRDRSVRLINRDGATQIDIGPSRRAWYSSSGDEVYIVNDSSTSVTKACITAGPVEEWRVPGGRVLVSSTNPDIFVGSDGVIAVVIAPGQVETIELKGHWYSFDCDISRELYVFGNDKGELTIRHDGEIKTARLPDSSIILQAAIASDWVYFSTMTGAYAVNIDDATRIQTLSPDRPQVAAPQVLSWNPEKQRLTTASSRGAVLWSAPRSH